MLRTLARFEWSLAAIGGGACLSAILLLTVITVYGRYILQVDLIPGGYNVIESVLFPLMVFWGLPLAHREGSFPRLELVETLASPRVGRAISAFVLLIEVFVYAIVVWYCGKFALKAFEAGRQLQIGTGTWPAWPIAMMAPFSFALMMIEIFRLILSDARAVFAKAES